MVGAGRAVPEGVVGGDGEDVAGDEAPELGLVEGSELVEEVDHVGDAKGKKKAWALAGFLVLTPEYSISDMNRPSVV